MAIGQIVTIWYWKLPTYINMVRRAFNLGSSYMKSYPWPCDDQLWEGNICFDFSTRVADAVGFALAHWSIWTPSVVHLESAYLSRLPDHLEKTLPDLHFRYHFHTQNLRFSQMFLGWKRNLFYILKVYSRCPVAGLLCALLPWQCIIIILYNIT